MIKKQNYFKIILALFGCYYLEIIFKNKVKYITNFLIFFHQRK